jgi:antitoxin component of MazEF toxin-antitoxin module
MIARQRRLVGEMGAPGSTSLFVRTPAGWARAVGVVKGSTVTVVFGLGNILLVVPEGREQEVDRLIAKTGSVP